MDINQKIEDKIYEEALAFPLSRFLKSDGSINTRKLKGLHPDFYQDALNLIFIRRAYDAHGKFFGYREVKFSTLRQYVKIYCPDHDDFFLQMAGTHLAGHGCPLCAHKVIDRVTEVGTYTVPCSFHKYLVDEDRIIWYNNHKKLEMELKNESFE